MANPISYRPKPGEIPADPGVYRFRDEYGRVIYVGKAKSLRSRLPNYFQDITNLHPRTAQMVTSAASVEWTVVTTEVEALALEYSWIKEFDPRFNVKYRDDKSYPYLAVTMSEPFPRALVMRGAKRKGTKYFGPYGHAWAIRETLDLLLRVFPIRTCSNGVFQRAQRSGRPCLLGYIDKCSAPCVGRVTEAEHKVIAEEFCAFMAGDASRFVTRITAEMRAAAAEQDYERAARLRDDVGALERALEKNAVVLADGTDADIFALAGDDLEAAVQVFHVRKGRIRGQRGWVVEKAIEISDAELIEQLIGQVYAVDEKYEAAVPKEVLIPILPPEPEQVTKWLSELRGSKVDLRVPLRGDKKELAATVHKNAEHALVLHRTKRAGDLTTRAAALNEIQNALDLPSAPLRIECYDISHTGGTFQSASMVVFEDGLPRKSEYRLFSIKGNDGNGARDDTAAMYEVIQRRFSRYLKDALKSSELNLISGEITPEMEPEPEKKRFAYPPNLVVVDGGQPQVAAAQKALTDLGITDVSVVGLAKRLEEVWTGDAYPVILPRTSDGLYLLQRLRDEAHRFAIQAHRKRRSKSMTTSVLDDISGLGPIRAQALLKHFGSLAKLKSASVDEIASVRGMGEATAQAVFAGLHPAGADSG
ncbi:MAG: excinuclease ABC subunit UvrC [Cellulomonadaceae bacterium]|jgi:excinuclease ABC subunit C|nr:excinuclease ABC subunit UvrC [Cellulomonadaceae bacterium]